MKALVFLALLFVLGCSGSDPVGLDHNVSSNQPSGSNLYRANMVISQSDSTRNIYQVLIPNYDHSCVFVSGYIDMNNNIKKYISGVTNRIVIGSVLTTVDSYYAQVSDIDNSLIGKKIVIIYTKI
jgi:hypothetical protein